MATVDSVTTALETAVLDLSGIDTMLDVGVGTDILLAADTTYGRVLPVVASIDRADSNTPYDMGGFTVEVIHKLSDNAGATMETYLRSATTEQKSLVDPQWWRAISGVHEVVDVLKIVTPERTGLVVVYNVAVSVLIDP